jgi:hypothetical protein
MAPTHKQEVLLHTSPLSVAAIAKRRQAPSPPPPACSAGADYDSDAGDVEDDPVMHAYCSRSDIYAERVTSWKDRVGAHYRHALPSVLSLPQPQAPAVQAQQRQQLGISLDEHYGRMYYVVPPEMAAPRSLGGAAERMFRSDADFERNTVWMELPRQLAVQVNQDPSLPFIQWSMPQVVSMLHRRDADLVFIISKFTAYATMQPPFAPQPFPFVDFFQCNIWHSRCNKPYDLHYRMVHYAVKLPDGCEPPSAIEHQGIVLQPDVWVKFGALPVNSEARVLASSPSNVKCTCPRRGTEGSCGAGAAGRLQSLPDDMWPARFASARDMVEYGVQHVPGSMQARTLASRALHDTDIFVAE